MIIQPKVPDAKLLEYIYDAAEKYKEIMEQPFLFAGKNRNTGYLWFECIFQKKQFMHLLGIKSKNYTAEEFFDICDSYNAGHGTGITIKDCTPSRKVLSELWVEQAIKEQVKNLFFYCYYTSYFWVYGV